MPGHISGAVRFSVESLLYYAPQVTAAGTDLAEAVTSVQNRLLDLGDFFGDSWPDQPFRDSYPRCQYAMLIIARQLADEIQGIGAGIEQMARTYGVAENENSADIARIKASHDRLFGAVSASCGGPQPPSTPLNVPGPPRPAGSVRPSPRAGPSPAPPSSGGTPMPHPTPSPQAGTDPSTWRQVDATTWMGPWPTGDPGRMEEAAACWAALQTALDTAWSDLQQYVTYILADTQGAAADAFSEYVRGLIASGNGSLTRAIEMAEYLHDACVHQAEEVDAVRRQIQMAAIELLAELAVTGIVAAITMGTTAEATAAVEAATFARLSAGAVKLAEEGTTLARILNTTAKVMSKAWAAAVVGGLQGAMVGEGDLLANDFIDVALGGKPAPGFTALKVAAESGPLGMLFGGGSAGGLLGLSAAKASEKLIELAETLKDSEGKDSTLGATLRSLGSQLKDGGITVSAANAALAQLVAEGKITPATFFGNAFANQLVSAISPHTGKHVAR